MSATASNMPLDPEQLNPTDRAILDALREGRATPALVANREGYTTGNVRNRMSHLASHEHVRSIGGGVYELVTDPRGERADEDDESAGDSAADESGGLTPAETETVCSALTAALRALDGQSPNPDTARAELERAQEVCEDGG